MNDFYVYVEKAEEEFKASSRGNSSLHGTIIGIGYALLALATAVQDILEEQKRIKRGREL